MHPEVISLVWTVIATKLQLFIQMIKKHNWFVDLNDNEINKGTWKQKVLVPFLQDLSDKKWIIMITS